MPPDNSEQIAEWNGVLGQRWVAMQQDIDRIVQGLERQSGIRRFANARAVA